jgi:hypothetical protein
MGDACYNPLLMSTNLVLTTPEEAEAILEYFIPSPAEEFSEHHAACGHQW